MAMLKLKHKGDFFPHRILSFPSDIDKIVQVNQM